MYRPQINMALGGMVIFLFLPLFLLANSWSVEKEQKIKQQIYCLPVQIDVHYDHQVQRYVKSYLTTGRRETEKLLKRAPQYFPIFEEYLQQNNLPEELKYLPVIESRLIVDAKSNAGAVGLWQFIKPTARAYDLRVNQDIDERLDVHKSTAAAMHFLGELYDEFKDWKLVLAAYNCGPGRVHRAIRSAGSSTYEKMERYLPRQTRRYIPKYIATIYAMEHFEEHNHPDKVPAVTHYETQQTQGQSHLKNWQQVDADKPCVLAKESIAVSYNLGELGNESGHTHSLAIATQSQWAGMPVNTNVSECSLIDFGITCYPVSGSAAQAASFYRGAPLNVYSCLFQKNNVSIYSQSGLTATSGIDPWDTSGGSFFRSVRMEQIRQNNRLATALLDEEPPWRLTYMDTDRFDIARDKSKYVHR